MSTPNDPPDNDRTAKVNVIVFVTNAPEIVKEHKAEPVVFGTIKEDPNAYTDEENNSATSTEKKIESKEENNKDEKKEGCHPCCEPLHIKP